MSFLLSLLAAVGFSVAFVIALLLIAFCMLRTNVPHNARKNGGF